MYGVISSLQRCAQILNNACATDSRAQVHNFSFQRCGAPPIANKCYIQKHEQLYNGKVSFLSYLIIMPVAIMHVLLTLEMICKSRSLMQKTNSAVAPSVNGNIDLVSALGVYRVKHMKLKERCVCCVLLTLLPSQCVWSAHLKVLCHHEYYPVLAIFVHGLSGSFCCSVTIKNT